MHQAQYSWGFLFVGWYVSCIIIRLIKHIPIIIFWILFSCEDTSVITGSENVSEISFFTFTNITNTITENSLLASGIIRNYSETLNISPPWYIECQFYYADDSGNVFLIGGESIRINNSLSPNISLEWSLEYDINTTESYDNFTINDLGAYKQWFNCFEPKLYICGVLFWR